MAVAIPLVKSDQVAMVAVAVVFGGVSTVAVLLRFFVALRISRRSLDASDICILVAWFLTLGLMVTCIAEAVLGGFGWHYNTLVQEFGLDVIVQYHKIFVALECLWNLSLTMTKMSVLLFYCKVFAVTKVRLVARITMVFVALLGTSGFLSTMLVCHPFAYNWDLQLAGGYCGNQSAMFAVFAIMNLATDVMVLTMPIKSLLGLKLPLWKKVSLMATFGIGFVTCIASILRLVFLSRIDYNDVTYTSTPAVLMSAVEPCLAVLLACIPLLRPLIARDRRGGSTMRSGKSSRLTTWMSTQWSRNRHLDVSKKRRSLAPDGSPGLLRQGSSEVRLSAWGSVMSAAVLNYSRYDSDDGMELRYVLSPGEGVSHHVHVEALPPRSRESLEEDGAIQPQVDDPDAASRGLAIVVKQEWNVQVEPKAP